MHTASCFFLISFFQPAQNSQTAYCALRNDDISLAPSRPIAGSGRHELAIHAAGNNNPSGRAVAPRQTVKTVKGSLRIRSYQIRQRKRERKRGGGKGEQLISIKIYYIRREKIHTKGEKKPGLDLAVYPEASYHQRKKENGLLHLQILRRGGRNRPLPSRPPLIPDLRLFPSHQRPSKQKHGRRYQIRLRSSRNRGRNTSRVTAPRYRRNGARLSSNQ